jgi:hypothetical protein
MKADLDSMRRLPHRPTSEFEWEDLLQRIELMPRALKVALEGLEQGADGVGEVLKELAAREERASRFLEEAVARAEGSGTPFAELRQTVILHEDKLASFVRCRTRNFAMIQRRGICVWKWSVELGDGDSVTVFQLFAHLALSDVGSLSTLRAATHRSAVC